MKFSENYQRHQTPRWIRSYCNYDKLKRTLKRLRESTSSEETAKLGESFDSYVINEIEIVEKAVVKRLASLRLQIAKVWRSYGITLELQRHSFIATISNMNHQEICHLLSFLHEQYEGQRDLQYFAKINSLAFLRILGKLKRISEGAYESVQKRLISCSFFHQIDILFQLHESKNRIEDLDNARKSVTGSINEFLLLKNICHNQNSGLHDLREVHMAIHENRAEKVITSMEQHINGTLLFPWDFQLYTDALVRSAISCDSIKFACELIVFIGSKSEFLTFDGTLIQELLQKLGKRKANSNGNEIPRISTHGPVEGSSLPFLAMLGQLYPDQRASFTTGDESGKIPLHYAAEYGLLVEYQAILTKMEEWDCFKVASSNHFMIRDLDGLTPLDLAVLNGHYEIVDATLQVLTRPDGDSETLKSEAVIDVFRNSLLAAVVRKDDRIVRLLLENDVNQERCWNNNESFLYIATRLGYIDVVRALTTKFSGGEIKINEAETVYGWTPLMVACVRGFEEIVKLLVEAGADQRKLDFQGLSAKENAMFRGYVQLAGQLNSPETSKVDRQSIKKLSPSYSQNLKGHLNDGKNIILVNLGTLDLTRQVIPVNLTTRDAKSSILYPESIYTVEVGLLDSVHISYSLALPLLEDLKNKPWYFFSAEAHDLKLEFKFFRATKTALEKGELVGSSIGILKSTEPKLGSGIESIIRDMTIPIQERDTLRYIGTITFTYMILTPSRHAKINTMPTRNAWKDVGSVKVVGHRGLGQNVATHDHLQIGENTLQSFLSVARAGARWVEFDVQMTKDLVPVVYHDFLVPETGIDAQIHTINLEQLIYLANTPSESEFSQVITEEGNTNHVSKQRNRKTRSNSWDPAPPKSVNEITDRARKTLIYSTRGFKSNTRGHHIKEPFATLEEILITLPSNIGFDIEIKYPTIFDRDEWQLVPFAIELNAFVDGILDKIFEKDSDREIVISSFSPDICILASLKQSKYPVIYLTRGGCSKLWDERARSLREAIHFAKTWDLLGTITVCNPILVCPKLVGTIKANGLICGSYGGGNNVPENAKIQAEAGLDIIVVDRFASILKTLQEGGYIEK